MSKQLIYTSCRTGLGGSEGDQIYSYTEGLSPQNCEEMVRRSGYLKPINMMDSEDVDQYPVQFEYYDMTGGKCFDLGTYQYTDYTKIRYGSRLVHHITADSLQGYPIEYFGNAKFRRSMSDEETGSNDVPAHLPEVSLQLTEDRMVSLSSVSDFAERCDMDFLSKMIYSMIGRSNDMSSTIIGFESFDDIPYYLAAMTMILPKEMAEKVTFTTYVMNPGACRDMIVCSLIEGTRLDPYGANVVTDSSQPSFVSDPIFDSYIASAYTEDSDREAFFDFLRAFSVDELTDEFIAAYNTFYISSFGPAMVDDPMLIRCVDFIKNHRCSDEEYIYQFYSKLAESKRYNNDFNTAFAAVTKSLRDETIKEKIQELVVEFDIGEMVILDPEGLNAAMGESESDVKYAIYSGKIDQVPKPHIVAVLLSLWAKGDTDITPILEQKQAEMSDDDVKFVSDVILMMGQNLITRLISADSPMDTRVIDSVIQAIIEGPMNIDLSLFMSLVDRVINDTGTVMMLLDKYENNSSYSTAVTSIEKKYVHNRDLLSSMTDHRVGRMIKMKDYSAAFGILKSSEFVDEGSYLKVLIQIGDGMNLSERPGDKSVSMIETVCKNEICSRLLTSVPDLRINVIRFGLEMLSKVSVLRPKLTSVDENEKKNFYYWVIRDSKASKSVAWYKALIETDPAGSVYGYLADMVPYILENKDIDDTLAPLLAVCLKEDNTEEQNMMYLGPLCGIKAKYIANIRKKMVEIHVSDAVLAFYDSHLSQPEEEKKGFLSLFKSKGDKQAEKDDGKEPEKKSGFFGFGKK